MTNSLVVDQQVAVVDVDGGPEVSSVDGLAAIAVVVGEVAGLSHQLRDHPEVFVSEGLAVDGLAAAPVPLWLVKSPSSTSTEGSPLGSCLLCC